MQRGLGMRWWLQALLLAALISAASAAAGLVPFLVGPVLPSRPAGPCTMQVMERGGAKLGSG